MRDWDAERQALLDRRKVALDRTMRSNLAKGVARGTRKVSTPEAIANYAAAKADFDSIRAEIETLEDERAAAGA